ncbi:MAG: CDP-alcohol phosphatidyltransferase family protein [Sedimentisphaerales bacterium]|jgi:CDP-diacylglycerol--glycerol-3-phosphate 3-phosphatidyltransferase
MLKQVPNILTFGRLVLTILFLGMLLYIPQAKDRIFVFDNALAVFLIAALTDIIDGPIARKLNVASKLGRMLDPLADKILVCGSFICFAIIREPAFFTISETYMNVIRWGIAVILIGREGYVTILRHAAEAKGIDFRAVASGKIKMFLQSLTVGIVLIKSAHFPAATWASWFTAVTFLAMLTATISSGFSATRRITPKNA